MLEYTAPIFKSCGHIYITHQYLKLTFYKQPLKLADESNKIPDKLIAIDSNWHLIISDSTLWELLGIHVLRK